MMSAAVIRNVIRRTSILPNEAAAARHFSTTGTEDSSSPSSVVDSILESPNQGATFGILQGIGKHTLKTDAMNLLQTSSSDLSPQDIRVDYNRMYNPLHMIVKFPTQSAFDSALRRIRGNNLYRLDRVDPAMWNIQSLEGKTVLLQGFSRNTILEDVERFLSGCEYNSTNVQIFWRPANDSGNLIKMALVQFPSHTDAMSAVLKKNRSFCLNNQISMRVLQ